MILITGGMGFIGLHTAKRCADSGEKVVITQWRARREPEFIKEQIGKQIFVESLDIRDADAVRDVMRKHDVTGIIHLAVPGLGALGPAEEYRTNMLGLLNIREAARLGGVKRVSLGSSSTVYQGLPEGPFREEQPIPIESTQPTPSYKRAFEALGLLYGSQTGLDVISVRIGGPYGPLYHSMASLPSRLCHAAARGVEPDFAAGRGGGVPFEDDEIQLCYVKDTTAGLQLLQMAGSLPHRIYNLSGGVSVTHGRLVEAIKRTVPDAKITLKPGRGPANRPNPHMDISRIKQDAGYEPQYDVDSGVKEYIDWLGSHPQ